MPAIAVSDTAVNFSFVDSKPCICLPRQSIYYVKNCNTFSMGRMPE